MTQRRHWKQLHEKDFKIIKLVLDTGVSCMKVAKIFDRSYGLMRTIQRTSSLDEYCAVKKTYASHLNGIGKVNATNSGKVLAEISKIKESIAKLESWAIA